MNADHQLVLKVLMTPDGKMQVGCNPDVFESPYQVGVALAMFGRMMLKACSEHRGISPAMDEQMHAEMVDAFVRDMQIPSEVPKVARIERVDPPLD